MSQTFSAVLYLREIGLVVLVAYAFLRRGQIPSSERVSIWSNPFLMLTVLWAFSSVFWSLDPSATFFSAAYALAILFIVAHFKSILSVRTIISGLALGLKVLVGTSMIIEGLHSVGIEIVEKQYQAYQGVTANPNLLAFLSVVAIVIFLVRGKKQRLRDWVDTIIWISVSAYLLFKTGAEAAPFYLVATLLILGILILLRQRTYLALPTVLLIIAFLIWASQDFVRSWVASVIGLDSNVTISGRTLLWRASLEAVQDRPMLGYGFSALRDISSAPNSEMYALWHSFDFGTFSSHNGYIEVLLQLGLIGLLLFLIALGRAGWHTYKNLDFSYLSLLIVLVLYNASEVRFFTPPLAWLLVCIVTLSAYERRAKRQKPPRGNMREEVQSDVQN